MISNLESVAKANELVESLERGIEMQQELLNGLRDSLVEYQDFLLAEMKRLSEEKYER